MGAVGATAGATAGGVLVLLPMSTLKRRDVAGWVGGGCCAHGSWDGAIGGMVDWGVGLRGGRLGCDSGIAVFMRKEKKGGVCMRK